MGEVQLVCLGHEVFDSRQVLELLKVSRATYKGTVGGGWLS